MSRKNPNSILRPVLTGIGVGLIGSFLIYMTLFGIWPLWYFFVWIAVCVIASMYYLSETRMAMARIRRQRKDLERQKKENALLH